MQFKRVFKREQVLNLSNPFLTMCQSRTLTLEVHQLIRHVGFFGASERGSRAQLAYCIPFSRLESVLSEKKFSGCPSLNIQKELYQETCKIIYGAYLMEYIILWFKILAELVYILYVKIVFFIII